MITRDLIGTNLLITQDRGSSFNLDTVLLSDFVRIPKGTKHIYDFGTGNGAIMLYLSRKTNAHITGIEIQDSRFVLAIHNIKQNELTHQLSVIKADIKTFIVPQLADIIVSNPPFFKVNENTYKSKTEEAMIARHEVLLDLKTLIEKMSKSLKNGGLMFLIHRPDRLDEIFELIKENKMTVKRLRFVHPTLDSSPNHVLIEAAKKGKQQVKIEPPLILYINKHEYGKELIDIYGGRSYATTTTR